MCSIRGTTTLRMVGGIYLDGYPGICHVPFPRPSVWIPYLQIYTEVQCYRMG